MMSDADFKRVMLEAITDLRTKVDHIMVSVYDIELTLKNHEELLMCTVRERLFKQCPHNHHISLTTGITPADSANVYK